MMSPLQQFLYARKIDLLEKEKRATGTAQLAMTMQLQVIDAMFQFLATQQTEDDMGKLQLTLDKQATPVDDIKPRQDNQELTEGLIELAERLQQEWQNELKRAKKAGEQPKDIKYPLNNLPDEIKPKSVTTKIYALRTQKKLPENILPAMRRINTKEQAEKLSLAWPGKPFEVTYMKWVSNPRPSKTRGEGK